MPFFSTESIWYQRGIVSWCLYPLSLLYRFLIACRRLCYQWGIFPSERFSLPLIVVGNITVGGTGKTPLTIALVNALVRHGYQPGIVSRGYGGQSCDWPVVVTKLSQPDQVGDEAVLFRQALDCPIVVDPNRPRAVKKLINSLSCDVVISDDGLQHYAMSRDIEIAVIDGLRLMGNGWCLPAGPLREPSSRLAKVDYLIVNEGDYSDAFTMHLRPLELVNVYDDTLRLSFEEAIKHQWLAVAGIGHPQRFFDLLAKLGFSYETAVYPDHHPYTVDETDQWLGRFVIMTEKDAVKVRACLNNSSTNARCTRPAQGQFQTGTDMNQLWYLPVSAVLEDGFIASVVRHLEQCKKQEKQAK